jgi:predicted nuclease of predicted toxin-antitoxin system
MRLLLDMNLSPTLCGRFAAGGHEAIHWSSVGDPRAPDATILNYASQHAMVVVTHDLDFGALLAASQTEGPSVVQFRTQDVLSTTFVDDPVNARAVQIGASGGCPRRDRRAPIAREGSADWVSAPVLVANQAGGFDGRDAPIGSHLITQTCNQPFTKLSASVVAVWP